MTIKATPVPPSLPAKPNRKLAEPVHTALPHPQSSANVVKARPKSIKKIDIIKCDTAEEEIDIILSDHARPQTVASDESKVKKVGGVKEKQDVTSSDNHFTVTKSLPTNPVLSNHADLPSPEPYNAAYPHPLTAYASPGVNPAAVCSSGYGAILMHLLDTDPDKVKGSILTTCGRENASVPSLVIPSPGEGNGIPERLFKRFESFGAARLPIGIAGISPWVRSATTGDQPSVVAPRFTSDRETASHYLAHSPGQFPSVRIEPPCSSGNRSFATGTSFPPANPHGQSENRITFPPDLGYQPTTAGCPHFTAPAMSPPKEPCNDQTHHRACTQCQLAQCGLTAFGDAWLTSGPSDFQLPNTMTSGMDLYFPRDGSVYMPHTTDPPISTASSRPSGLRRVSRSLSTLFTVAEAEGEVVGQNDSTWSHCPDLLPIGAEHSSPRRTEHSVKQSNPLPRRVSTIDTFCHPTHNVNLDDTIKPRSSTSSLSTSSSPRYSLSNDSTDISLALSPIDAQVGSPYAFHKPRTDNPPTHIYKSNSPSFDFSTGKSIWC